MNENPKSRPLLRLNEANELLDIASSTAYDLIKRGAYPATVIKVGGSYRVLAADVDALLAPTRRAE